MMQLGNHIISNYEQIQIERTFLEKDFRGRKVLKIITDNSFDKLLANDKINILLQEIWDGKQTYDCDGEVRDFSQIVSILCEWKNVLPG